MAAAASDELIAATDLADLLVKRGVPFRECHGIVAGLVRDAVESGRRLSDFTPAELRPHSEHLDAETYDVLAQRSWLESKVTEGGTALPRVREQLALARAAARRLMAGRVVIDAAFFDAAGASRSHATSSAASCATATPRA